jgi:hypothetical protein
MAAVVSLSKLFATGRLGSLHAGVSLGDAALALGPPVSWSRRSDPLHGPVWVWHYGEIALVFGSEQPWPLYFFAVEDLPDVAEPPGCLILGNALGPAMVLDLDGIDRRLRPSDALSLVRRRGDPARILYWPLGCDDTLDPSLLTIAAGDVAVSFEVFDDELGGNANLAALTDTELWSLLGNAASVHRILCGVRPADPLALPAVAPRRLDVPDVPALVTASDRDESPAPAPPSTFVRAAVARVAIADFLATGRLGPVHHGLTRNLVASLLGAPDGWIGEPAAGEPATGDHADAMAGAQPALPVYWTYGKLEFSFGARPPHPIDFFQIEFARLLSGDCEILAGGRIVLDLHGLDGRSHPSDFLRVMRDGAAPLQVGYSRPSETASFALWVSNGPVTLVFDGSFPDDMLPGLAALAEPAYLRRCDRFAQLDSIYVYPPRQEAPDATRKVAAAEYLAAVTGEP